MTDLKMKCDWMTLAALVCLTGPLLTGCDFKEPAGKNAAIQRQTFPSSTEVPEAVRPEGPLPRFTDVSVSSGAIFRRYDDIRGLHRILEATGGGVALLDYDRDARSDVFFTNGSRVPRRSARASHPNTLFRNLADGRFVDIVDEAGLRRSGFCHGAAVGDCNSDGFPDLYVTAFGPNRLWCNNGDGTFKEVTDQTGTGCDQWSSSAAFADLNADGHLDLFVVNYLDTSDDPPQLCPDGRSPDGYVQCVPALFQASEDVLYLSDGRGRFCDATRAAGVTGKDGKGLGVVAFDADRDRDLDLYLANDGTPNFLYVNQGPDRDTSTMPLPRFEELGTIRGGALNFHGVAEAGMGIAAGDYDADGWTDLLVTNFAMETNTLYRNLHGEGFDDHTASSGLAQPGRRWTGWGAEFFDVDNDGWLDLFIANGHVDDRRWEGHPWAMPPLMFRNERNGLFVDVSKWAGDYFRSQWHGRGAAVGDLDNDGDLDLVVSHQLDRSAILRNDTPDIGPAVIVQPVGIKPSNRSAVGTMVEVEGFEHQLIREVTGGGSFQSSAEGFVHIGLGEQEMVPILRIHWPSARVDEYQGVQGGRYVAVENGNLYALSP